MGNVKINRICPFKEWLTQRKLNEGVNPDKNVNAKHIHNNVYALWNITIFCKKHIALCNLTIITALSTNA